MKITVSELQSERPWRSATGFDQGRFHTLLSHLKRCYLEKEAQPLGASLTHEGWALYLSPTYGL